VYDIEIELLEGIPLEPSKRRRLLIERLAKRLELRPQQIEIARTARGMPYLSKPCRSMWFSFSRSGSLGALASAGAAVAEPCVAQLLAAG
jgi:phosphopantetheinyl transferase